MTMRKTNNTASYLYCMYTGEECTHCNKCEHMPQYTIINQIPQQSSNWLSKVVIIVLIIFIIYLLIMLAPYFIGNISGNLMQSSSHNSNTPPTYVSNYQPQSSSYDSGGQSYNVLPMTSTSNRNVVPNTSGEAYNSMG